MADVRLRAARADAADEDFLWRMLVEAASWRPGEPRLTASELRAQPSHALYLESWGRAGDAGVIAQAGSAPVGAAWWRVFSEERHGYGFIEAAVPELSIGVLADMRGRGVGTALLQALIEQAREGGVPALSLSVEGENPALRLYRRLGFTAVGTVENALTMRLDTAA